MSLLYDRLNCNNKNKLRQKKLSTHRKGENFNMGKLIILRLFANIEKMTEIAEPTTLH